MLLAGCIGATDRADFTDEVNRRRSILRPDLVTEALDALAERLGTDDPQLTSISISIDSGTQVFEVRDPQQPANLDRYTWSLGWRGDPEPQVVSADDDLDARTFRASRLRGLGRLARLQQVVRDRLGLPDLRLETVTVRAAGPDRPELVLTLGSDRAGAIGTFTGGGEPIEVRRT
mgnify:FL=1